MSTINYQDIVRVYTQLLDRNGSRFDLGTYFAGEAFSNYLFDIGFFQGVLVSYDLSDPHHKTKLYTLDELPWFTRERGDPKRLVSDERRQEINHAFKAFEEVEYAFLDRLDRGRSDSEETSGIVFVPSWEISALAFHDGVERANEEPSPDNVRRLAGKLGLISETGQETRRLEEMLAWLGKCLGPATALDQHHHYQFQRLLHHPHHR